MLAYLPYLPLVAMAPMFASLAFIIVLELTHSGDIVTAAARGNIWYYVPVVHVIIAAMCMYYIFLFNQSRVAFDEFDKEKKAYDSKRIDEKPSLTKIKYGLDNANVRAANRLAGNFNEQLAPFIISLLLYSTFVSVKGACYFGWAWLFFRSYYFIVYDFGVPFLFLSTIPAYCCIWGMLFGTVWELSKSQTVNIVP